MSEKSEETKYLKRENEPREGDDASEVEWGGGMHGRLQEEERKGEEWCEWRRMRGRASGEEKVRFEVVGKRGRGRWHTG